MSLMYNSRLESFKKQRIFRNVFLQKWILMVEGQRGTFWSMLGVLVFRNSQEICFRPIFSIVYTWLFSTVPSASSSYNFLIPTKDRAEWRFSTKLGTRNIWPNELNNNCYSFWTDPNIALHTNFRSLIFGLNSSSFSRTVFTRFDLQGGKYHAI